MWAHTYTCRHIHSGLQWQQRTGVLLYSAGGLLGPSKERGLTYLYLINYVMCSHIAPQPMTSVQGSQLFLRLLNEGQYDEVYACRVGGWCSDAISRLLFIPVAAAAAAG